MRISFYLAHPSVRGWLNGHMKRQSVRQLIHYTILGTLSFTVAPSYSWETYSSIRVIICCSDHFYYDNDQPCQLSMSCIKLHFPDNLRISSIFIYLTVCGSDEVMCEAGTACIMAELVCDGHPDCYDYSDELHCGKNPVLKYCKQVF